VIAVRASARGAELDPAPSEGAGGDGLRLLRFDLGERDRAELSGDDALDVLLDRQLVDADEEGLGCVEANLGGAAVEARVRRGPTDPDDPRGGDQYDRIGRRQRCVVGNGETNLSRPCGTGQRRDGVAGQPRRDDRTRRGPAPQLVRVVRSSPADAHGRRVQVDENHTHANARLGRESGRHGKARLEPGRLGLGLGNFGEWLVLDGRVDPDLVVDDHLLLLGG
jgi:hypothetical protein